MVVYYINKVSESLTDYRYPIKEGDICMLYDGEVVKTIYIDSEKDSDSIWRDFKFIDTKSLKSYQFPTSDSILCAPIGSRHAIGNTGLLTQLIQECKGEWLLDFLNETSAVLSGFVDYWDLKILKRFTGDDDVEVAYENEEALIEYAERLEVNEAYDEYDDEQEDVDDSDFLPQSNNIKWFCLSALTCIEGQIDSRSYQILYDTLNGELRSKIALRFHLTQERIRQIVVKATKQAKELLIEQRRSLDEIKAENSKLKVQLNILKEDIVELKAMLPKNVLIRSEVDDKDLSPEITKLLDTPLKDINLPARAYNILLSIDINKFADIPQFESSTKLLSVRNSGRKTVNDVTRLLEDFHLTFGMSLTDVVNVLQSNDWHAAKRKWIGDRDKIESKIEHKDYNNHTAVVNKDKASEDATIELTRDIIEAARTPNGGFTKSQLSAIGIDWPPPQDWIEKKVGTMITPKQLEVFNRIEYVASPPSDFLGVKGSNSYKEVAYSSEDRKKMEAVLQAMSHFFSPATPRDIARTISRSAWGDEVVHEDSVDSYLKRLPEVDYIKWGKYILKSRNK